MNGGKGRQEADWWYSISLRQSPEDLKCQFNLQIRHFGYGNGADRFETCAVV